MKKIGLAFALIVSSIVIIGCSGNTIELIAPDAYISQFVEAESEHLLIDVRTPAEYASGHIAGSINIPVDEIANRLAEIPTDMPVVVYCQSGNRSGRAASILMTNDYNQVYDLGGIARWRSAGYPIE
ncbi:MAG: rhodanese-like domain-containing protein [Phototrophicaceae bacterium]